MTMQKNPSTSLTEDFAAIGISYKGQGTSEPKPASKPKQTRTESNDPLDGPYVTNELFDRIMALPLESVSGEDIGSLIEGLKEKKIPKDASEALVKRAEEVVRKLFEVAKRRKLIMRRKKGKTSFKKSFLCARGLRKDANGRCIRSAVAAGGMGKLTRQKRKKKMYARSGAGKKSKRKTKRLSDIAGSRTESFSPFAAELGYLLEDTKQANYDVRDEIIERIDNILVMLSEEFVDEGVTQVFAEAFDPIMAAWDAGRMDEDVVGEDEFMSTIKPVLTVITKSLDRLDRQDRGELGNG